MASKENKFIELNYFKWIKSSDELEKASALDQMRGTFFYYRFTNNRRRLIEFVFDEPSTIQKELEVCP